MRNWKALAVATLSAWLVMPAAHAQQRALSTLDYYEIQNLYARFAHALDSGADNGFMFADVFTTDGAFVDANGRTVTGRDQLAAIARGGRRGPTNVETFTNNVVLESSASGALGKSYLMVGRRADAATNTTAAIINGGQYWDDLVRTSAGWRIRKRVFVRPGAAAPVFTASATPAAANPVRPTPGVIQLTAEDYAEIHHMYARYGYAFDGGVNKGRMWAELFTEDGFHVNHTANEYVKGHDSLADFARGAMRYQNGFVVLDKTVTDTTKNPLRIGHIITNFMFTPTRDGVVVKAYRMTGNTTADAATITPGGIYFDFLVKTPQGWRYKEKFYMGNGAAPPPLAQKYIDLNAIVAPAVTSSR